MTTLTRNEVSVLAPQRATRGAAGGRGAPGAALESSDMHSKRRNPNVARPRQVAMALGMFGRGN